MEVFLAGKFLSINGGFPGAIFPMGQPAQPSSLDQVCSSYLVGRVEEPQIEQC